MSVLGLTQLHEVKALQEQLLTLHTSVADVVFPTPGGPDNRAHLNIEPSSLAAKKPLGKTMTLKGEGKNVGHC